MPIVGNVMLISLHLECPVAGIVHCSLWAGQFINFLVTGAGEFARKFIVGTVGGFTLAGQSINFGYGCSK